MKLKVQIINNSALITTNELQECLKLLSSSYRKLDTTIIIFNSYKQYLFFLMKNFRLLQFPNAILQPIIEKITKTTSSGLYFRYKNEIYIFQDKIMLLCNTAINNMYNTDSYKIYGKYITNGNISRTKNMWFKYITLDTIIHELTHAYQHSKNRLSPLILHSFRAWEDLYEEKDAVSSTIKIFDKKHNDFCKILSVKGIKIKHSLTPLNISYKFTVLVKEQ